MDSYVFDIILITLAVVVLLHLFYNNSLLAPNTLPNQDNYHENMDVVKSPRTDSDRTRFKVHDSEYRDPGTSGLDRTDESKRWYHVANKLVSEDKQKDINKLLNDVQANVKSNNDSKYNTRLGKKDYKLVFEDLYDGSQTSDPSKEWLNREPRTLDHEAFESNNKDEKYEDNSGNTCNLRHESVQMKRYIRDYVLDGQAQCGCAVDKSKSEFTRDEIDKYREGQLRFEGDKINKPSDPAVDPVDKMNIITMKGGIKGNGKTISDFYDNLVDTRVSNLNGPGFIMGTSIPSTKCVEPPTVDLSSGVPHGYYTGFANAGGKYFMADNWMYSNENPNNGGMMFDGIHASDPMINDQYMV